MFKTSKGQEVGYNFVLHNVVINSEHGWLYFRLHLHVNVMQHRKKPPIECELSMLV